MLHARAHLAGLLALVPTALPVLLLASAAAAQVLPEPALHNTRLAAWPTEWGGEWGLILIVSEAGSGHVDLNGDGDNEDFVPVIYDVARTRFTVFDLPIDEALFTDGGLVLLAGKNGPPFQLHTYRRGAAKVDSTGVFAHDLSGGGTRALFHVSEKLANADLTGDGDAKDVDVLHAWDAVAGWHNYGVDVYPAWILSDLPRDRHVLRIDEARTGADMDGDGASDGTPIAFVEPEGTLVVAPGVPGIPSTLAGPLVLLWVDEDGVDQNGNGYDDATWYLHDRVTGATSFVGGPVFPPSAADGERWVVGSVLEFLTGGDRNGDGDDQDLVPVLLDLVAGTATPLPIAVIGSLDHSFLTDSFLAVLVDEQMQGQDLTGDGDLDDEAFATVDLATLQIVQTPLEARRIHVFEDHATLAVTENAHTGDLNGDGVNSTVLVVYDHTTGTATPTLFSTTLKTRNRNGQVLFERTEAAVDINGDGDLEDRFVAALHMGSLQAFGPYGASGGGPLRAAGYGFAFTLSEADALEDLNGDYDIDDEVTFVLRRR